MMRRRYEITDEAWEKIAPLFPSNGKRGGQWKDHRIILNGIPWKFGTGAPWRDLPERYGSWKTCYYRFTRWQKDGTWDRLLKHVQPTPMQFPISTGSSSSTAQLSELISTPQARRKKGDPHFQNEALGRSRGGLTTKIHLACDGKGRPLAFTITPGQQHDCTQLQALLDSICVPHFGKGRPRKRPDHLIADRGYSYPFCRRLLLKRGIPHTIPERKNQAERRSKKPGRPLSFRYARRNMIERCINRLKQWRGFATRYEKRAVYFCAAITLISLMIWLN